METEKLQREQDQDVIYTTITDPYGFIYITTNLINGRRYVRQKIFSDKKTHTKSWVDYLGSGTILKQAIEKERKENFSREIVYVSYNAEDLNKAEKQYTDFFDAKDNEDWYNLAGGGDVRAGKDNPNYGKPVSKETREKLRQVHLGRKNTPEHNEHIRQAKMGDKNPMYRKHSWNNGLKLPPSWNKGIKMSEESKKKVSESRKGQCKGLQNKKHQAVKCVETNEIFPTIQEACQKYGITSIQYAIRHHTKTKGFHWEAISDEEYQELKNE